jgi:carbonic anhydrase
MTNALLDGLKKYNEEHGALSRRLAAEGQKPDYFIISCIDSRSNPGTIFRPAPGTFFAHKAMGAIVRPYKKGTALAAALQFALLHNGVRQIVILGHTGCGAIRALADKIEDDEISSFVDVAQEGLKRAHEKYACNNHHDDLYRHAEEEIVLQSVDNLKTYPSVQKTLNDGLKIFPWLFDLDSGTVFEYGPQEKIFKPITES